MVSKPRVLFLCVHNSARSQMAEGLLQALAGDRMEVYSAGSDPTRLHPFASRVLQDEGIDVSSLRSKSVDIPGPCAIWSSDLKFNALWN